MTARLTPARRWTIALAGALVIGAAAAPALFEATRRRGTTIDIASLDARLWRLLVPIALAAGVAVVLLVRSRTRGLGPTMLARVLTAIALAIGAMLAAERLTVRFAYDRYQRFFNESTFWAPRFPDEAFRQVEPGWTRDQVVRAVGTPLKIDGTRDRVTFLYTTPGIDDADARAWHERAIVFDRADHVVAVVRRLSW
jgi:hypothetical protein